jgi:hypothetical protein
MRDSTKLRLILSAILSPFLVVVYLNVEKFAEDRGWDSFLVDIASPEGEIVLSPIFAWALNPIVSILSVFVVGIVAGVWVDACIRREGEQRAERYRALGDRCFYFVQTARIRDSNAQHSDKRKEYYDRLWSIYLPIVSELEQLKFKTPDGGITNDEDLQASVTYCEFVGNLLKHNQIKTARVTAKSLSRDPNQPTLRYRIRQLVDIARTKLLRRLIPLGPLRSASCR